MHVLTMKQHGFQVPGWAVDEEPPLARVTGDSNYLKQTNHIVAEEKLILTGEEAWKRLVTLSLICDMHTSI